MSTSWSGGYAQHNAAQDREFESHLTHRNFVCVCVCVTVVLIQLQQRIGNAEL